ncbi:hypothetical protein [Nannocystis pusilla]|uniref:Lipoprotein n=1 Tax=Nannocystis pusilla TaxID=889268 RepID=A0ABS7U5J9_9BACT|nr:hypothetical protein [Nannocystis pusilla]MBZ5715830.1 hypothetical protein [Nannocystis pusilla]
MLTFIHRHGRALLFTGAAFAGCGDAGGLTTDGPAPTDASTTGTPALTAGTGEAPTSGTGMASPDAGLDEEQCDPWAQDCPEGYKCMAYADEGSPVFTGNRCTPVAKDPGKIGDPCRVDVGWWTGVDDCDDGLACWNIHQETNTGECVSMCTGTPDSYDCPGDRDACVFWVPGIAHVCLPTCDPLLQDCQAADRLCLPEWGSDAEYWVCKPDYSFEEGQEFDVCEYGAVCDPGLVCSWPSDAVECDQTAEGCCLAICDLTDPVCHGEGAVCEPFYGPGEAPPAYENVGVCGLPG